MKRAPCRVAWRVALRPAWLVACLALCAPTAGAAEARGPSIRRAANMPDGAPAFDVLGAQGQLWGRIECIQNGWYDSDALAARLLSAPGVMAAIIAKQGRLAIDDLGPGIFNCVVVVPKPGGAP